MVNFRQDNTKNWNKNNPILKKGDFGIEFCNNGVTKLKIGNGKDKWTDLKYLTIDKNDFENLFRWVAKHNALRVKQRIDYDYIWDIENPILLRGELGFSIINKTVNMKIGDGKTHWKDLEYIIDNSILNEKENMYITEHQKTKKVLIGSVIMNILMAIIAVISNVI